MNMLDKIKAAILQEADKKPWSNSWKYVTAKAMLKEGRPISFVSDTLGVSYRWLLDVQLIKYVTLKDKQGAPVKVMRPV